MDRSELLNNNCLNDQERVALQRAWRQMRATFAPMDELIERAEHVDCDELHDRCVAISDGFEEVEHLIMLAKQMRTIEGVPAVEADC